MRIGLDGTPLTVPADGTARYTVQLSLALAREFPLDRICLFSDQPIAIPEAAPANLCLSDRPSSWIGRHWWLCGLPRELSRQGMDVFHGTGYSVPYLPLLPSVVTIHDLSPWREHAWHHEADRVRRRTPFLLKLGLASMVLTDTEAVRREVCEHFRLPASRVAVLPLAAASVFQPAEADPGRPPYFLYVGAIEPRKNLPVLVEAWREVARESAVELVIAGRQRLDGPIIRSEPGLRLTGVVEDEELARLYNGALAVVYPSLYEGFGLPVVEAMSCGAAVVASRDAALMEVSGGAAMHVDAGDVRGWVQALRALVRNPGLSGEMRARSLRRARDFSWKETAQLAREVYAEAARRFGT